MNINTRKLQFQNNALRELPKLFCIDDEADYYAESEGGNFGFDLKKTITKIKTMVTNPAYMIISYVTWELLY